MFNVENTNSNLIILRLLFGKNNKIYLVIAIKWYSLLFKYKSKYIILPMRSLKQNRIVLYYCMY